MGMNVRLHPCDERHPERVYYAPTVFELDKWCNVLADITSVAKLITLPVQIHWTDGDFELRHPQGQGQSCFDPDCTWLIQAGDVLLLKLWDDTWHPDRIMRAKAIQAYFGQLAEDWRVIAHYV
jgi:hypothetical protein